MNLCLLSVQHSTFWNSLQQTIPGFRLEAGQTIRICGVGISKEASNVASAAAKPRCCRARQLCSRFKCKQGFLKSFGLVQIYVLKNMCHTGKSSASKRAGIWFCKSSLTKNSFLKFPRYMARHGLSFPCCPPFSRGSSKEKSLVLETCSISSIYKV